MSENNIANSVNAARVRSDLRRSALPGAWEEEVKRLEAELEQARVALEDRDEQISQLSSAYASIQALLRQTRQDHQSSRARVAELEHLARFGAGDGRDEESALREQLSTVLEELQVMAEELELARNQLTIAALA